ncbi:MAG: hypothetical protein ABSF91_02220 [Bacteroidota bacterium]
MLATEALPLSPGWGKGKITGRTPLPFASWCANSGVSMYTLQNLMGHSSITVTESYATPDQGSVRAEVAKITLEKR